MGEKETKPFQFSFNGLLKVNFQGSCLTSDGGLILVRELDERLGLGNLIDEHLSDSRQGLNTKFPLVDLLRQSVYSRLAGYEDLNDAVRVSADPTFRLIGTRALKHTAEWIMRFGPAQIQELVCRRSYSWYLRRKSSTWTSPQEVFLGRDYLKLHTESHRTAVTERFEDNYRKAVGRAGEESGGNTL